MKVYDEICSFQSYAAIPPTCSELGRQAEALVNVVDDQWAFKFLAATTRKTRLPIVLCNVQGTSSGAVNAERSTLTASRPTSEHNEVIKI
jgi:hypothetical protein